jgi:hypothetical protein
MEKSITQIVGNLSSQCQKLWKPKSEIVAMPLYMNCELRTKVGGMTSVCYLRETDTERVSSELFLNHFDFQEKNVHLYGACPWYNGRSSCICWTW